MAAPYRAQGVLVAAKLVSARLYATALGVYVASINGQRVGDDIFTPGWTDYRKRVQYQVYDVTDLVRDGRQRDRVCAGRWLVRRTSGTSSAAGLWRPAEALGAARADVRRRLDSRRSSPMRAGRFSTGPILESDMLQGESYDARREMTGWDTAGCDGAELAPMLFDGRGSGDRAIRHRRARASADRRS